MPDVNGEAKGLYVEELRAARRGTVVPFPGPGGPGRGRRRADVAAGMDRLAARIRRPGETAGHALLRAWQTPEAVSILRGGPDVA